MTTSDLEYRVIEDEFGKLTQKLGAAGKYSNYSRELNDVTFMLGKERKTVDYLLAFKAGGVQLRLNEMNDRVEIWGELDDLPDEPEPITDILQANVLNWLLDVGLVGRDRMLNAISTGAWRNRYHPIRCYLDDLVWDGVDYLAALFNHVAFSRESAVIGQTFIRRWLIGSVAKLMEQAQNFMLVVDGAQGIGKSYLAKWLCPIPIFFIEGAIHPEDKDAYKRLMSYWIWEVGELEGTTRKSDRAALKDFITRREVTIRLPYGRYDITKPASASLLGTINEDGAGFLKDPTGSRRFAVVKLDHIDFGYVKIDRDQLWAQVLHLYKSGEPWELRTEERLAQAALNEDYEAESAVEQYLRKYYEIDLIAANQSRDFMASVDLLENLKFRGLGGNDRANLMEISTTLRREGLEKKRRAGLHGYYGVREKNTAKVGNLANL